MPNSIKIKRSLVTASPASLAEGELAYSEVSGNLFIGKSGNNIDIIGGNLSNPTQTSAIQAIVGAMVSGNTESGISITYDGTGKKLNFDVNDPTISITGDVSGSATMTNLGNTSIGVTLPNVNSDVGSYGSATTVPVITVNAKGQVTAVGTATITLPTNPTFSGVTVNGNITVTGTVDGIIYTVPAGFITDFATTPWWAWSFFPKIGPWTKASVLHDYFYKEAIKDKAWADKEFHAAMLILDTPRIKAYIMYLAVKFFGRGNYYVGKL